jgi:hypothetical protein
VYQTFTVERHVDAPRQAAWDALLAVLDGAGYETPGDPPPHGPGSTLRVRIPGYELLERTVSLEAPWRRVYQHVEGAPARLAQGTTAIRDDGPTCHVAWALIAEAEEGGDEATAAFMAAARPVVERALERVAAIAEGRVG